MTAHPSQLISNFVFRDGGPVNHNREAAGLSKYPETTLDPSLRNFHVHRVSGMGRKRTLRGARRDNVIYVKSGSNPQPDAVKLN
jgi:hypothetical protein